MDASTFDQLLIDALWNQLHSTHTPNSDVLDGDMRRIDKGSQRGLAVYEYTSAVTGNPVYKQSAGNTFYLHGDKETIEHVHEQAGPPKNSMQEKMKALAEGRDTYEVELGDTGTMKTYSAGSSPKGTTSEEYWAYWCNKLGYETDCTLSPPTGEGRSLQEVLEIGESVEDHEWRPKEEGREIAERIEKIIQEGLGDFPYKANVQVEFSTSYHGQGFTLWAGQAAWPIGDRNDSFEDVLESAKDLLSSQEGALKHYADPSPSRGSTGEDWFEEEG